MIKLTSIFKKNKIIGSMIELVKEINGNKVYTVINKKNVKIIGNDILVDSKEINRLSWFFKSVKTTF